MVCIKMGLPIITSPETVDNSNLLQIMAITILYCNLSKLLISVLFSLEEFSKIQLGYI